MNRAERSGSKRTSISAEELRQEPALFGCYDHDWVKPLQQSAPVSRIGGYEIVSHLGTGGMGEVYRAHDAKLNRDVAIKILPGGFAHDEDRVARFTREAQTLAALNHPNIAQIYGVVEA